MVSYISYVCLVVLLILVASKDLTPYKISQFELRRRTKLGDERAKQIKRRNANLAYFASISQILQAIILIEITILGLYTINPILAIVMSLVVGIFYNKIASLKMVRKISNFVIKPFVNTVGTLLLAIKPYVGFLSFISDKDMNSTQPLYSRFELQHLLDNSHGVLTADEKSLIISSLEFDDKLAKDVMVQKDKIVYIKKNEFLGPLALSELYNLGHDRLPVIDKDINQVVGILHIKTLLALDTKKSATAEKVMDPKVYYVNQDQTLRQAVALFLTTHHHMGIVINEKLETVGIITLDDVLSALFGKKLSYEFDDHDNIHAVARRVK